MEVEARRAGANAAGRLLSQRRRIVAGVRDGGRESAGRTSGDFLPSDERAAHEERATGRGAVLDSLLTRDSTRRLTTRRLARSIDRLLHSQLIRSVIHRKIFRQFWWRFSLPPKFCSDPKISTETFRNLVRTLYHV